MVYGSKIVVELEIINYEGKWYRKGLCSDGSECWEELESIDEEYSSDWISSVIKEVENG